MIRGAARTVAAIVFSAWATTEIAMADRVPKGVCFKNVDDRLEILLAVDLKPSQAPMKQLKDVQALGPLFQFLVQHAAWIEPSIAPERAVKLHLLRSYTVRFKPGVHKTPQELLDLTQGLIQLGPTVIARAAPVPSARPPSNDPYVGAGRPVTYPAQTPCGTQWYLFDTGVDFAWNCSATGASVVVADVDWGFDLTHSELSGAWDPNHTYDMCNGASAPGWAYHGTGVAGLIAARQDGNGIQGIAYQSTIWPITASCSTNTYLPCEAKWESGNPWADAIAKAATDLCDSCRKVVVLENQTCCYGNYEASIAVNTTITAAIAKKVVVVVAAGNGYKDATYDDVGTLIPESGAIVVGSTDYVDDYRLSADSNFGARILVSAPGDMDHDLTLTTGGRKCLGEPSGTTYSECFGGTSGAAAKVAGVVALMLQKNTGLDPEGVREILKRVGKPVTSSDGKQPGGVFLDAHCAVAAADPVSCGPVCPTPTPTPTPTP